MSKVVQLFYSYAHEDELLRSQLDEHLKVLVREGLIESWYDHNIDIGKPREDEIRAHLQAAQIILLLLSPAFIASDYTYSIEMTEALRRHRAGEVRLVPIVLRPCLWEGISLLKDLQVLPRNKRPVTSWTDRDEAFTEIVREIGEIAATLQRTDSATDASQVEITKRGSLSSEVDEKDRRQRQAVLYPANKAAVGLRVKESTLVHAFRAGLTRIHTLRISAVYWTRLLSTIVTTLCVDVIANSVGIHTWVPQPLFELLRSHPTLAILLSSLFILIVIFAWIIAGVPQRLEQNLGWLGASTVSQRLLISTILSTTSFLICFVLLATIILRAPWCPDALCPAPVTVLNPHASSDGTLETYFTTIESENYVIPDNPSKYTLANLPDQISALRIDQKAQGPYRVVFAIHSLQRGNYGMFINQISLVVDNTPPSPRPLNIWYKSAPLDYRSNPFRVTYAGEPAGRALDGVYVPLPGGQVQLAPGENDEIDLEVASHITVDLRFHIQVTYRVTNQSEIHTLAVPGSFEVVFADKSNWHPYQLADGRLVPQ